ncbi:hypothetical protein Tco_0758134 [Tanacetum coccineum]
MEALHLSVCKAVDEDVFKGIQLQGSLALSHLFYADDAFFMGEWSDNNLRGDNIDSHSKVRKVSIWSSILKEVQVLKSTGSLIILSYCSKRNEEGYTSTRGFASCLPFGEDRFPALAFVLIMDAWFSYYSSSGIQLKGFMEESSRCLVVYLGI